MQRKKETPHQPMRSLFLFVDNTSVTADKQTRVDDKTGKKRNPKPYIPHISIKSFA